MARFYLFRHGKPALEHPNEAYCLGQSDPPLSREGRFQAALLGLVLPEVETVAASTLQRAEETARIACGRVDRTLPGLCELSMGQWDGLPFSVIRQRWPEEYRLRGLDMVGTPPPGGERPEDALARFSAALANLMEAAPGDTAAAAHTGVIRLLLCRLTGRPLRDAFTLSQPHGCVNILTWRSGRFSVEQEGVSPHPEWTAGNCLRLLRDIGCSETLIAHCQAVARLALDCVRRLNAAGQGLDERLVETGALLHDLAREEPNHAAAGGAWLRRAGYEHLAEIVTCHHDWDGTRIDEAAVVFLADKLVQGDRRVTLEERFAASAARCVTAEAKAAHERRFQTALRLRQQVERAAGKDGNDR